jgi:hypothetical protein
VDEKKKAKLGTRFTCFSCAVRFYDLNKPEPICPKCGSNQNEAPAIVEKPKPKRKAARKKKAATINPALVEDDVATANKNAIEEVDLQGGETIQVDRDS